MDSTFIARMFGTSRDDHVFAFRLNKDLAALLRKNSNDRKITMTQYLKEAVFEKYIKESVDPALI